MKLALLGDIHGNINALEVVLAAAKASEVEMLLVTGDLIGYYFEPLKVIDLLAGWNKYVVRGNHEDMLSKAKKSPDFLLQIDLRYGTGLRVALEQLNDNQVEELCNLPHPLSLSIEGCKILLCHGSPWDKDYYIYPDAELGILQKCAFKEFDLVVLGHTHYPMRHVIDETIVVNPGSVGQPRNHQPGAQWVMFDTETRKIEFRCEPYDVTLLAEECRRRHPQLPYLAEVLTRI